ncbi:MAG: M48 family metallopeptidase [Treponema sp.]|nr:M48 family metallopeptidase [Treponema sp.]
MTYTFEMAAIPFEVEYRPVKAMRLTVYPPDARSTEVHRTGGRVRIAAPPGTAPDMIKKFAASKIKWIEKHRARFLSQSKLTSPLRNNSTVYVWGTGYALELVERRGNPKIVMGPGTMTFCVRPGSTKAKRQEFLDKWYRTILKEAAELIIKKWEPVIGVEVKKLYVRKMKSHWGSCSYQKQTLRLNSELAKRNAECLEYVIVHEMLHIIEKGHNRKFYRLLSRCIPEWKAIRKRMNTGG